MTMRSDHWGKAGAVRNRDPLLVEAKVGVSALPPMPLRSDRRIAKPIPPCSLRKFFDLLSHPRYSS